ncbi:VOC family protein [Sphaerotilaceae bacterium SBD11-9]
MSTALDHLVVAARTLDEGVAWCEATLGVTPGPGGRHALMSTHNRLLDISCEAFPRAYLEVIAIDPEAPPPGRTRWFDLDDAAMQAGLARGPRLVHWVARCSDLGAHLAALSATGWERGEALQAERGRLRWQISVRPDGQRLCGGALPTLIEWGPHHPSEDMPASGLQLRSLVIEGLPAPVIAALQAEGAQHLPSQPPGLRATLATPQGLVELRSHLPTDA